MKFSLSFRMQRRQAEWSRPSEASIWENFPFSAFAALILRRHPTR